MCLRCRLILHLIICGWFSSVKNWRKPNELNKLAYQSRFVLLAVNSIIILIWPRYAFKYIAVFAWKLLVTYSYFLSFFIFQIGCQTWLPGEQLAAWHLSTSQTGDYFWTMSHTLNRNLSKTSEIPYNHYVSVVLLTNCRPVWFSLVDYLWALAPPRYCDKIQTGAVLDCCSDVMGH